MFLLYYDIAYRLMILKFQIQQINLIAYRIIAAKESHQRV